MRRTLTLVVLLIGYIFSHGKIWIVDNNPISVGDFTTLADAHAAAADGDTIFVYPSTTTYSGITLTKKLHIYGVGYNLNIYGGQAQITTSKVGTMAFNDGAQGSVIEGLDGNFTADINNAENIIVRRCNLGRCEISSSNIQILQNDIVGSINFGSSIEIKQGNLANIMIANNKIINTNYGDYGIYGRTNSAITIVNNVIRADKAINNGSTTTLVQSNIIMGGSLSKNPVYLYNMSNSNQLPPGNGNLLNIDMTTVFENPNDYVDGLHLLPGSPAKNAGYNGTDMGIYGGAAPYIDGGFPGLPAIYHLESEVVTTPQRGLNVLIKAKSNKE